MDTIKLGTRGSALAIAQSTWVARALEGVSGRSVSLVVLTTRGDQAQDRPLAELGGKGLFTAELEEALHGGVIDLAVHSMKDLPSEEPAGLVVAATPARADPRDVLVGARLDALARGAVVGTGSARRRLQLLARRPDLDVRPLRGNVDTRLRKVREGHFDAVVLAAAGLDRLQRGDEIAERLDPSIMVPAVGQGALAVQCREGDATMVALLAALHDEDTGVAVRAERSFLAALQGGCSVPAGCHAEVHGGAVTLRAFFGRADGVWVAESGTCPREEVDEAGVELATRLRVRLSAQPPRARGQEHG